jgi:uncharacterized coiled-coil protein SlyX
VEHARERGGAGTGRRGTMSERKPRGPLWLRAVHRLERAVGEPVEAALHSDAYFDLVAEILRARGRTERALESLSRRVLHLVNLPAGSDIRRVREQLARMERRLVELSEDLDQARAERTPPHQLSVW